MPTGLPDEVDQRLGEIGSAWLHFEDRPCFTNRRRSPELVSSSSTPKDTLAVDRGCVRPEEDGCRQLILMSGGAPMRRRPKVLKLGLPSSAR